MRIKVLFFGKLGDIPGVKSLDVDEVSTTDELMSKLQAEYPTLKTMPFLVAVDKQIIQDNTALSDNCTVALLPPYAGG